MGDLFKASLLVNCFDSANEVIINAVRELTKQKEEIILEQLGELVTSGLIEIQETQPVMVRLDDQDKFEIKQAVKLHFKGFERIQELEKENDLLKSELKNILNLKERLTNE